MFKNFRVVDGRFIFGDSVSNSLGDMVGCAAGIISYRRGDFPSPHNQQVIEKLANLAQQRMFEAAERWADYIRAEILSGRLEDNDSTRHRTTAAGFIEAHGEANTLDDPFGPPVDGEFGSHSTVGPDEDPDKVFSAYALLCIDQAISKMRHGETSNSFDRLAQAALVLAIAKQEFGKLHAEVISSIQIGRVNSAITLKGHQNRKTNADFELIKTHWLKWINKPFLHATKAEFIREMFKETTALRGSDDVVLNWIKKWEKERGIIFNRKHGYGPAQ